jgi:hypothetical protein
MEDDKSRSHLGRGCSIFSDPYPVKTGIPVAARGAQQIRGDPAGCRFNWLMA